MSDLNLKEYVDVLTKCPICLEDLVKPKSLQCLHTFCFQCIKDHCRDDSPGDQVNCPVCRTSFVIPVGGVEQLPDNFFLKGLADAKKAGDKQAATILCGGCYDDSEDAATSITPATMHCTGCGQNLCQQCSRPHRNIPGGAHVVVPLGCELQGEVLKAQGNFCRQHHLNKLEIYCIECNENMCVTCCHTNKHKGHNCQAINEVYQQFRSTLERDKQLVWEKENAIQLEVSNLKKEQREAIDDIMKNEADLSHVAEEIKRHVDDAVNRLMMLLSKEKADISKVACDRENQFEFDLAAFQSFTRYSSELIKTGKPCDITNAYTKLHTRAGELLQREVKTHDYQLPTRTVSSRDLYDEIFHFISTNSTNFKEENLRVLSEMKKIQDERDELTKQLEQLKTVHDNKVKQLEKNKAEVVKELNDTRDQLNRLQSSLKWLSSKVKPIVSTEEGKAVYGLTKLNNELFVGYRDDTEITVYDSQTLSVQRILKVPRLGGVYDMTSCKRQQRIYVADHVNKVVHRVANGNTITQWPINDVPDGISVNSVHNVLVTSRMIPTCPKVKEFTTDGKLIREIKFDPSIVYPFQTIELTADQLVVCNGVGNVDDKVCVVDTTGRILQLLGGGSVSVPIRLEKIGALGLFVADGCNQRVLILSPTLGVTRVALSGLRFPTRILFDDETGQLYVGDNNNVNLVSGQVKVYGV